MDASTLAARLQTARRVYLVQVGESRSRTTRRYVALIGATGNIINITRDLADALDFDYDPARGSIESVTPYMDVGNGGARMADASDLAIVAQQRLGVSAVSFTIL